MQKIVTFFGVFLLFVVPTLVSAGPIIRSGESISVDAEQMLKGDFYGAASDISLSGNAENDVYLLGGTVTVNAPVAEDLTVLGGVVQVHGEIGDDIRIVGGEVTIAKPVKGDVVVLGSKLTILSTATIEGDLLFYGESLSVEGGVMGSIHGVAETIRINELVGGDVSVTAFTRFSLGDAAKIQGTLSYKGSTELERAPDAEVVGEIHRLPFTAEETPPLIEFLTFEFLILLFAALALYVLARAWVIRIVENTDHSFGMYGLIGLCIFLSLPVVSIVLMVSVVGILLGIMLLLTYIIMLIVAFILGGALVGLFIGRTVFHQKQLSALSFGMGVGVLLLIGFIPHIGGFLVFACMMVALGKIGFACHHALRA